MRRCVLVTLRAAGHGDVGLVAAEDKDAETDERKPSKAFGLTLQHTHKKCTDSPSAPILVPRCPPSRACLSSSLDSCRRRQQGSHRKRKGSLCVQVKEDKWPPPGSHSFI